LRLPKESPFDYQLAMDRLRDFRAPRDKLRRLCESGDVIQVKRGLNIPVHLGHLQQRMEQTGHWEGEMALTGEALKSRLRDRFSSIDFDQAKDDVLPFVQDADAVALWGREFFLELIDRVAVESPEATGSNP